MLARCLGSRLVSLCWEIWRQVPAWSEALAKGDWPAVEAEGLRLAHFIASELMAACLCWHLERDGTRSLGKTLVREQGLSHQGIRDARVTLATGRKVVVRTRYALPERSIGRDYRCRPGRRRPFLKGCYPFLDRLGFVNQHGLLYCQEVAQAALLCPSLDVAKRLLASRDIETMGTKIRTTCVKLGRRMFQQRCRMAVSREDLARLRDARVVTGVDGG